VAFLAPDMLIGKESILFYICGFAFFRFFDILKMGPVKYADTKIKNAYGVMLDDVFAGLFASVCLLLVLFVKINL
jgi:phosphatidylglycerophosphatase A